MSLRQFALFAAVIFAAPANTCEMHGSKAQISTPAIDVIKTASMEIATPVVAGDITIEGYWIQAMFPGQPVAGGFLKLTNNGSTDDKLVSASSPKSGRVELHEMAMKGEVMQMREIEGGLVIPAGATIELAPGGLHVMFFDISEAFKDGDMVAITLNLEKAGAVELMVPVMAKSMKH